MLAPLLLGLGPDTEGRDEGDNASDVEEPSENKKHVQVLPPGFKTEEKSMQDQGFELWVKQRDEMKHRPKSLFMRSMGLVLNID